MSGLGRRGRRVLLLVAVVAAGAGAVFAVRYYRNAKLDGEATRAGDSGRAALAAGDYPAALDGLTRYLLRFQNRGASAEDFVLYARARRNVEEDGGKHLVAAMAQLRRALAVDPANAEAKRDLLDLFLRTGYWTEALELIETMLGSSPGDVDLLRKKLEVIVELRQFSRAIEIAKELNVRAPDDLASFFRTLDVMFAADTNASDVEQWVDATLAAHPKDPRFELLRAAIFERKGDPELAAQAGAILDRVIGATAESTDPKFLAILVDQLDAAGRFKDALVVLERPTAAGDQQLRRELVRRLYYGRRWQDLVTRIEGFGASKASADPELVAIRVLALRTLKRVADAEPLEKELAARTDPVAKAWSTFLAQGAGGSDVKPRAVSEELRTAIRTVPNSALLRQALGDASAALGDTEIALDAWGDAAARAPSWSLPLRKIARTLLRSPGREAMAVAAARAAFARAPNELDTISTLVQALAQDARGLDPAQRDLLIRDLDRLQTEAPQETEALVPIQVGLLLQTNPKEAERRLHAMLDVGTAASESTLLRLAQTSQAAGIDLETAFFDLSESSHGVTPQLALARAISAARSGGSEAGLRVLDGMRQRAPKDASTVDWDLVRASYLDLARRTEAGPAWVALADGHMDMLQVQLGALGSPAVWRDREAVKRLIDRVHELTGDRSTTWRIAQARYLLETPNVAVETVSEAAEMLTEVTQEAPRSLPARRLLAQALEFLGNLAGAEEQLHAASDLAKDDTSLALELARIAQAQGHTDDARRHLERGLASNDLGPAMTERAAFLLAVQGDLSRGADLLEPLVAQAQARREGILLLVKLYGKLGELDRALALAQKLLDRPDTEVLEIAAGLYAQLGRKAEADVLLGRLEGASSHAGEAELVRARHAAQWGAPGEAKPWYDKAVAAAPDRADAWSSYLAFAIASDDMAAIASILDDARSKAIEPVQFVAANRELFAKSLPDPRLRLVLMAAITQPKDRDALLEAARLTSRDWSDLAKRSDLARAVRGLADSHQRVMQLQILSADLCAAAGDLAGGCQIASRAMNQFPDTEQTAWQAADLLMRSQRWNDALEAALVWSARAGRRNLRSELFVARAMLRTGRAADAAATLETHLPAALARPDQNEEILLTYAAALVSSDRVARAADLLSDLIRKSDRFRTLPLLLAPEWLGDAKAAKAWLRTCAANVPEGDARARFQLARAWAAAWEKYPDPDLLAGANELLAELTSKPDASAEAHFVAATVQQVLHDVESARKHYEAALEKDGASASTRNNFAMLLADSGDWKSAVDQATKATETAPRNANYLDTLAYAYRKGGDLEKAQSALRKAVQLDPGNAQWQIGLAEVLAEQGRADEAKHVTDRVDQLASVPPGLSQPLQQRLEKLRERQQ